LHHKIHEEFSSVVFDHLIIKADIPARFRDLVDTFAVEREKVDDDDDTVLDARALASGVKLKVLVRAVRGMS
jgi:hypothetical protein